MKSEQQLKADARKSAQAAPKADPEIAEAAKAEAKGVKSGKRRVQPVYKTQDRVSGKNIHRDKSEPMSEFDNPAGNMVSSGD